jgi:hypothetical protein
MQAKMGVKSGCLLGCVWRAVGGGQWTVDCRL